MKLSMQTSPCSARSIATTLLLVGSMLLPSFADASSQDDLAQEFASPPNSARLRAYWWWLNGCVTTESITRDLEEMKAKGFGGALICDADGSSQDGNIRAPHGPTFFSTEWRELYKHALREADRLELEMSLNIQSGWNLGGPMVKPEDAPKKLTWSESRITGGTNLSVRLDLPSCRDDFYRDLFVLAWPVRTIAKDRKPLQNQREKSLLSPLKPFSAPDSTPLFQEVAATPGEEDVRAGDVLDLTKHLSADGTLNWKAPAGEWRVIRFGFTLNDHCRVSTCSEGWDGYAIDPFDDGAFVRYWDAVVEPLIADAGPLAGKSLKYLHTDSWEVEVANWTPHLREEFQKRRGYDLLPWLPVVAGKIVNSRDEANRFLHDFRRTIGDLAIDHHYKLFKERAHAHGLLIHPESGGPHAVPIDAQQCLGFDDAPMSEFWAWSWKHRIGDANRFFVKQPASAAHTYGHKLVLAEGFTTIGPHWQETLWDNLKPSFDQACCEGLNLLVWHAFVCSPQEQGIPGLQYFAGTHLNPNVTWWAKSAPFFSYINRCQAMLQRGLFVADVCYYYGDHVPNFAQHKRSDPTHIRPGYDYDVITGEALLARASVKDGRIVLPDGMSYRLLVLRDSNTISLPILKKVKELVAAGAKVVGPKPASATSLYDSADDVKEIAAGLWDQGRVVANSSVRDVLLAAGVKADFEFSSDEPEADVDYIHRRDGEAEIYFVANRSNRAVRLKCIFRVAGKAPELWNAVNGERRFAAAYVEADGRTTLPLELAPCGSSFVVFRDPAEKHPATATRNEMLLRPVLEIQGPWKVQFPDRTVSFQNLISWTEHADPSIKFHSGTACYTKSFSLPPSKIHNSKSKTYLDLGDLRELAEVRLNGRRLGIVWTPPFQVDVTGAVKPEDNILEVEVVNFWPNRIIGDDLLPPEKRVTKTNIRKLTKDTPLMRSGLFGPVRILAQTSAE